MDKQRLNTIIEKILAGNATTEDVAEINSALEHDQDIEMVEEIRALLSQPEDEQYIPDHHKWDLISAKILQSDKIIGEPATRSKVTRLMTRISIAAAVLAAIASGIYFFGKEDKKINLAKSGENREAQDISAPGRVNALLSLSNGTTIELNTAEAGSLSVEGNSEVIKLASGEIIYNAAAGTTGTETTYNTLTVPKGSKLINVTLADGTKAWLNNESSLRYPTSFNGDTRTVEITGEAYFEVSKDDKKPFFVKSGETTIKVLGTHFNVNAYSEAAFLKVTLLEGSVNVSKASAELTLQPGQQALVKEGLKLNTNFNVEEVMAWKNGKFAFYDAEIKTVMDQVARWYDLDIVFKGVIREKFHVEITRNTNVSNVLKILEGTGAVHFKFEQNKLVVMP